MKLIPKIKDTIHRWKQNPVLNVLLNKYTIVVIGFILVIFFAENNVSLWLNTEKIIRAQNAQIELRTTQIKNLEERIDKMNNVTDSLEKFAREEYYFHEDGEDVYVFDNLE